MLGIKPNQQGAVQEQVAAENEVRAGPNLGTRKPDFREGTRTQPH